MPKSSFKKKPKRDSRFKKRSSERHRFPSKPKSAPPLANHFSLFAGATFEPEKAFPIVAAAVSQSEIDFIEIERSMSTLADYGDLNPNISGNLAAIAKYTDVNRSIHEIANEFQATVDNMAERYNKPQRHIKNKKLEKLTRNNQLPYSSYGLSDLREGIYEAHFVDGYRNDEGYNQKKEHDFTSEKESNVKGSKALSSHETGSKKEILLDDTKAQTTLDQQDQTLEDSFFDKVISEAIEANDLAGYEKALSKIDDALLNGTYESYSESNELTSNDSRDESVKDLSLDVSKESLLEEANAPLNDETNVPKLEVKNSALSREGTVALQKDEAKTLILDEVKTSLLCDGHAPLLDGLTDDLFDVTSHQDHLLEVFNDENTESLNKPRKHAVNAKDTETIKNSGVKTPLKSKKASSLSAGKTKTSSTKLLECDEEIFLKSNFPKASFEDSTYDIRSNQDLKSSMQIESLEDSRKNSATISHSAQANDSSVTLENGAPIAPLMEDESEMPRLSTKVKANANTKTKSNAKELELESPKKASRCASSKAKAEADSKAKSKISATKEKVVAKKAAEAKSEAPIKAEKSTLGKKITSSEAAKKTTSSSADARSKKGAAKTATKTVAKVATKKASTKSLNTEDAVKAVKTGAKTKSSSKDDSALDSEMKRLDTNVVKSSMQDGENCTCTCSCGVCKDKRGEKVNLLPYDDVEIITAFFKALSDPTRFNIVYVLLTHGELSVSEVAERTNMSMSAVSHQLALLRMRKLVTARRDGVKNLYALCDDHVSKVIEMAIEHIHE